jgi:hypothetical protein
MFIEIPFLMLSGRTPAPAVTENRRSYRCGFHPEFSNPEQSAKPLTRIWLSVWMISIKLNKAGLLFAYESLPLLWREN